jgi:hypothetical protein
MNEGEESQNIEGDFAIQECCMVLENFLGRPEFDPPLQILFEKRAYVLHSFRIGS